MKAIEDWAVAFTTEILEIAAIPMAAINIIEETSRVEAQASLNDARATFQDVPLDAAVLADMVERNIMPLDKAATEASFSAINAERFAKLVEVTGEPPGLMQMLNLWRRHILPTKELERMVAYSRVRTEWTEWIKELAHDTMGQADALNAAVKGVLTDGDAEELFVQAGGLRGQYAILRDTSGEAIGVQQVEHLWLHGLATSDDVKKVILHSRINPMFEPLAAQLYHRYASAFQIRQIVASGGATPEQATKWLIEEGYPPDQAAAFTAAVAHGAAKKAHDISEAQTLTLYEAKFITAQEAKTILTHLGYPEQVQSYLLELTDAKRALEALNTGVGYVRKAYLAGRINDNEARTELGELQVPNHAKDAYLAAWAIEKKTEFKTLTQAQVGVAFKKGFITLPDATTRLMAMGYNSLDSSILLAEHGGPPPAGSPAAGAVK